MATERPLDAPVLTFDLPTLLTQIKREAVWQRGQRNGITLLKSPGLRVVLVAMHAGTAIATHRADSPLSFQVVEGVVRFSAESQSWTLAAGHLLTLHAGIAPAVEAVVEAAFRLTLATPSLHPAEP
jgi:quercetin dioxygenase-like cupin family protein